MRHLTLSLAAIAALTIQSCSNEIDPVLNETTDLETKSYVLANEITVINDGKTLLFRDQETFDKVRNRLINASDKERIAFADSLGFESLFKIMTNADIELNNIVEQSSTQADFNKKYKAYKDKYSSIFAFNDAESEELFPYLLVEDFVQSYYTGKGMNVIIGNKEITNKKVSSINEWNKYTVYSDDLPVNDHVVQSGKRKVGLHMYFGNIPDPNDNNKSDRFLFGNFTAQKKNMFGWVRYSTIYYGNFSISRFYYRLGKGTYPGYEDILADSMPMTSGVEQSGNYNMPIGYPSGSNDTTGEVQFWSRGVGQETPNNKMKIDLTKL